MLTKFLKVLISILAFPCGFILATSAADGQITVDPLPRIAVLTATTNAPVSASGLAVLGFPEVFVGMDSSNLHVSTEGLFGGVYTVSVTDEATNTYDLGTFTVPIFTNHTWTHWPIPLPIAFPNLTNELMVIPSATEAFSAGWLESNKRRRYLCRGLQRGRRSCRHLQYPDQPIPP